MNPEAGHHSVFPPFQKGGTQILKISERGEPEKKYWWGKTKEGKVFQNERGELNFSS